jgi:hypothetical protein
MKHESANAAPNVRRTWTFVNAIGLGVSMAIFAAVAEGIEQSGVLGNPELGDNVGHIIGLALAGVIFGLLQWAVLRRHFTSTGWGVLGTSIGLAIGYILGYTMGGPPFDFILAPALAMLLGGFAQWLALRRQTAGASWWVATNTVGFMIGGIFGTAIAILGLGDALGGSYPAWIALNGVVYLVAGAVGGAISSPVLARMLRRAGPKPPRPITTHADASWKHTPSR